jgi:hypothetical protein
VISGVVVEKTGFYSILVLFSIGVTHSKASTPLAELLGFKHLLDADPPVTEAIPSLAAEQPGRYDNTGLTQLAAAMHARLSPQNTAEMQSDLPPAANPKINAPGSSAGSSTARSNSSRSRSSAAAHLRSYACSTRPESRSSSLESASTRPCTRSSTTSRPSPNGPTRSPASKTKCTASQPASTPTDIPTTASTASRLEEPHMHAAIRKYRVIDGRALLGKVEDEFVQRVKAVDGFIG